LLTFPLLPIGIRWRALEGVHTYKEYGAEDADYD
jgi:hypothetical protein